MTEHFKNCCQCQGTRSDRICRDGCKRAQRVLEAIAQKEGSKHKESLDEQKEEE